MVSKFNRKRTPPIDRFNQKYIVDLETRCWEWNAALDKDGYGCFRFSHESGPVSWGKAYVFAYEYYIGRVPHGKQLDHVCRNRKCVNPYHLDVVDLITNVMRGESFSAINARKTHCIHNHPLFGENLYVQPSTGYRYCRTCKRNSERKNRK